MVPADLAPLGIYPSGPVPSLNINSPAPGFIEEVKNRMRPCQWLSISVDSSFWMIVVSSPPFSPLPPKWSSLCQSDLANTYYTMTKPSSLQDTIFHILEKKKSTF